MATNANTIVNTEVAPAPLASKSPTRMAVERFMYNKFAIASVVVLFLLTLMSICAPLLTHQSPTLQDLANTQAPPGPGHPLGTDNAGTDLLARDLYGGRVDLLIGLVDMVLVMAIGIVTGGLAGYYGGWVDAVVMRAVDFMFNFPFFLVIIVLSAIFNTSSIWLLIGVIGFVGWPPVTRMVRSLFLNLRESEFVLASQMAGAGVWRIIVKHMLPNTMGTLVVTATFQMAYMISAEAALAVIGFGVKPPTASWGTVLSNSLDYFTLKGAPWEWLPPALLISITILCINFIGDGLRDAFDPGFEK